MKHGDDKYKDAEKRYEALTEEQKTFAEEGAKQINQWFTDRLSLLIPVMYKERPDLKIEELSVLGALGREFSEKFECTIYEFVECLNAFKGSIENQIKRFEEKSPMDKPKYVKKKESNRSGLGTEQLNKLKELKEKIDG